MYLGVINKQFLSHLNKIGLLGGEGGPAQIHKKFYFWDKNRN